jgi:hypothetical protein
MEITIIIFLILCLASAGYGIWNLLNKLERYEDFINEEENKNNALLEALRQIDSREMFEKDDDVGSIFYQIKETIERFKQFK